MHSRLQLGSILAASAAMRRARGTAFGFPVSVLLFCLKWPNTHSRRNPGLGRAPLLAGQRHSTRRRWQTLGRKECGHVQINFNFSLRLDKQRCHNSTANSLHSSNGGFLLGLYFFTFIFFLLGLLFFLNDRKVSDHKPNETQGDGGPPLLGDKEVFESSMAVLLEQVATVSTQTPHQELCLRLLQRAHLFENANPPLRHRFVVHLGNVCYGRHGLLCLSRQNVEARTFRKPLCVNGTKKQNKTD